MEDRYLFKAKDCNSIWRAGLLIALKEGRCAIEEKDGSKWACDSETLCQCTGLKDENGKLIWENDVVRVTINSGSTICRCAFADTVAHFQLWQKHTIKSTSTVLNLGNYECEVVGNIFDNKDLLESEG